MSATLKKAMTMLIVASMVGARSREAELARPTRTVRVINDLGNGQDLTIHCKQKSEDLGEHVVHPNEAYEFTFTPKFWGTSLYLCGFAWPRAFHRFDIFAMRRNYDACFTCVWKINQDRLSRLSRVRHIFDECDRWPISTQLSF